MQHQRFIGLIGVLFCALMVQAQNDTVYNGKAGAKDDWYVEFQVGGSVLFNGDVPACDPANTVRPVGTLTFGKWFNPYLGLRLQAKGGWWNGAATLANATQWGIDISQPGVSTYTDGMVEYNIFYLNPHVDLTLSLANCIYGGWKESTKWDVVPFAGIGYLAAFRHGGVPAAHALSGNFGIQGKYRINANWDINLELSTTILPAFYEQAAGAVKNTDLAFTFGFTYNIGGHKYGMRPKKAPKPVAKKDTVFVYNNTETIIERPTPVFNPEELAAAVKAGAFDKPFQIGLIEFGMDNDQPKRDYETQYYNVAAFIAAYPEATLRLDAYCDAATGTEEYNDQLAQRRAQNVRDILVNKYGVDADKIVLNPIGSREQVYERTSLNRIVRITVLPK